MMKHLRFEDLPDTPPQEVIFAWNYLEWGGAQMYFLGIARRIKDRCRVRFLFPRGTDAQFVGFCETEGIEYHTVELHADLSPARGIGQKIRRHLSKIRAEICLIRALKGLKSDGRVVHVELSPWQSILALAILSADGPVCATMHNRLPAPSRWREVVWRAKFAIAARLRGFRLFTSNKDAKKSLEPYVSGAFLGKTLVTYTNIDPDEIADALGADIDAAALRKRFGIPADDFLVVTVGQFIDRKGRWDVMEAARILDQLGEKVVFAWVSNSELTEADQTRIYGFGLGNRFRLIQSSEFGTAHLDLMKFLRIADAFVLPSYVEGLPISLLEAMTLGIPGVSTAVNAIPEAIVDGETGLLIDPGDSEALADSVRKLKSDTELRLRIGKAGREKVLAEFNEREVAELAFGAYTEALFGKK